MKYSWSTNTEFAITHLKKPKNCTYGLILCIKNCLMLKPVVAFKADHVIFYRIKNWMF